MRLLKGFIIVVSLLITQAAVAGPHKKVDPQPTPPELLAVEDALAGPQLVGLYYLDLDYIMRLEGSFVGEGDTKALPTSLGDDDILDNTSLGFLRQSGLKATETVEYVVGGFTGDPKDSGQIQIAIGHFPADALIQKWKHHSSVQPTEANGRPAWLLTQMDRDTCKPSKPELLVIDERFLIIGDPQTVEWFLKRLHKAKPAKDLSTWRAYRSGKPFAFSIMLPKELQKVSDNMMAQMLAQNAEQKAPSVTGIYGGGTVTWKPEGITLELRVESGDSAWNQETLKQFEDWKREAKKNIGPEFKSVNNLFNYLTVESTNNHLTIQFKINEALVKDFEKIITEGVDLFTASLAPGLSGKQSQSREETIPYSEINQYTNPITPGELDPFDAFASPTESYSAQSGPFGIRLKGISLNPRHKHIVDLHTEVISSPFPDMELNSFSKVGEGAGAWFRITHVYDAQGRELLLDEPCGKDRNSTYATLRKGYRQVEVKRVKKTAAVQKLLKDKGRWSTLTLNVLQGTKVAHLRKGILLSDIDRVEGEIVLQLPASIQKRRIQAPFKGKEIQAEGLRIKMKESQAGAVTFIASGDVDRLLETRALNQSGKYLRSSSKMASPILFGQGVNSNTQFQGAPRTVEFVLAQKEAKQSYPFAFKFQRPFQPLRYPLKPVSVSTESKRGFMQKRAAHSPRKVCSHSDLHQKSTPFHFCLSDRLNIQSDWQSSEKFVTGDFKVHGPDHGAITHNLSAAQLTIDKVIFQEDGKPNRITLPVKASRFVLLDSSYAPPLQGAQVRMKAGPVDPASEHLTPVGFEGTLQVRLPRKLESFRLDLNDLGNTAQAANGLRARFLGIADNQVHLEISGPRETLVQLRPQDAARQDLAQGRVTLKPSDSGSPKVWQAEIHVSPETRYLAVVYATRQDTLKIPFHLEP